MKHILIIAIVMLSSPLTLGKEKSRILIIGDSLTAGYGVSKDAAFPSQLQKLLGKSGISAEVINAGTSGSTSASVEKRLLWHLRGKPDLLIVALGANDGLRGFPVATTKSNLKKAIDLAKKNNLKFILAGMKLPKNYGEPYRSQFANVFTDLAKLPEVHLIPFLLKGVAGESRLNLADGIHPNEEGHKIIAKTVFAAIKDKL